MSGYHMAVVAGVVFFVFSAGLALIPGIALRHPIKKWGALAAFLAATFYLVLSGAEVATQRPFIMIAILLKLLIFFRYLSEKPQLRPHSARGARTLLQIGLRWVVCRNKIRGG
jgi:predicted membrane metal-binding protein